MYYNHYSRRDLPKSKKRNKKYTTANEPYIGYQNNDEIITQYPDMEQAYDNFSKTYNIPKKNFILTTGTDASYRIALSSIRHILQGETTTLIYTTPNWGLIPIIAEMEGFNPIGMETEYGRYEPLGHDCFHVPDYYEKIKSYPGSVIYVNSAQNNYFNIYQATFDIASDHNGVIDSNIWNDTTYIKIIDEVYEPVGLYSYSQENKFEDPKDKKEDKIIIGSYSKVLGCGIRLGYILFDDAWTDIMYHNRETYLSPLACMHTQVNMHDFENQRVQRTADDIADFLLYKGSDILTEQTYNFTTVFADKYDKWDHKDMDRVDKEFTVSGIRFYRLGMPKQDLTNK